MTWREERLAEFIEESNRIEGIVRPVSNDEVALYDDFLRLNAVPLGFLCITVATIQPEARLRQWSGMNVRVGNHFPPQGGPGVASILDSILADMNALRRSPYECHHAYESLHPFTDGNGRSGRLLWLWMHVRRGTDARALNLGFLHTWYYESLDGHR